MIRDVKSYIILTITRRELGLRNSHLTVYVETIISNFFVIAVFKMNVTISGVAKIEDKMQRENNRI